MTLTLIRILLCIWMLLVVHETQSIKRDIKSIQWRISRLEWKEFGKSDEVDKNEET
jgi:hypothetical protein